MAGAPVLAELDLACNPIGEAAAAALLPLLAARPTLATVRVTPRLPRAVVLGTLGAAAAQGGGRGSSTEAAARARKS
jgi:hypothetical protein